MDNLFDFTLIMVVVFFVLTIAGLVADAFRKEEEED